MNNFCIADARTHNHSYYMANIMSTLEKNPVILRLSP